MDNEPNFACWQLVSLHTAQSEIVSLYSVKSSACPNKLLMNVQVLLQSLSYASLGSIYCKMRSYLKQF